MLTYTPYHYYFGIILLCIIICMSIWKVNTSKKHSHRQSQTREESQEKPCTTFSLFSTKCHVTTYYYATKQRCLFQRQVNFCESNSGVSFILHRCWDHDEILWENMTRYNIPWWESPWSYPTSFSLFITSSKHQVQKWDFFYPFSHIVILFLYFFHIIIQSYYDVILV